MYGSTERVTCHFWFRFAFCYLNFCFASRFFLKFSLNFAFCLDYNTTVEYEYQGVVQFCLSPIHVQYSQCSHAKLVGHAILSKKFTLLSWTYSFIVFLNFCKDKPNSSSYIFIGRETRLFISILVFIAVSFVIWMNIVN